MTIPFDYVNSISYNKKEMDENLPENEYVPFIVNRALSYFPDTVLYANEMNINSHIDKKMQYDYLMRSIRARKRFSKWHKTTTDERVQLLQDYYKCNRQRAEEALSILSDDQLQYITKVMQEV